VVGFVGLCTALWTGYSYPMIANMTLLCEISTFFLNYRSMYQKEELGQPLPMANQLVFALTFIVLRMIGFPYFITLMGATTWTIWEVLPWHRRCTALFTLSLFVAMILLNTYWFLLITKGLKRILQSAGLIK